MSFQFVTMNIPGVLAVLIFTLLSSNHIVIGQSTDAEDVTKPDVSSDVQLTPIKTNLEPKNESKAEDVPLSQSIAEAFSKSNGSIYGLPDLSYTVPIIQEIRSNISSLLRAAQKSSCNIKQIPSTSLFSETYYRVMKKNPENGVLTYVDDLVEGAYNLQIDAGSYRAFFYTPNNSWYGSDQWIFREASDSPGWYELRNKLLPKGLAAVSSREIGNGFQAVLSVEGDQIKDFAVGGAKRDRALWKAIGVKDEFFQLKNKQFPDGFVTHATRSFFLSQYHVQVDVAPENSKYYELGGKWYDDTLFSVLQRQIVLDAKIHQFRFPEISSDSLSAHTKTSTKNISCESTVNSANETSCKISNTFQHKLYLSYNLEGKFGGFNKTSVNVELPVGSVGSGISGLEIKTTPEGVATEFREIKSLVKMDLSVPLNESLSFSAYSQWIADLSTPFEATMEITGNWNDGGVLNGNFIRCNLPDEWKNSQINKETEYTLELTVKGQFVGTFGHKRVILTQM